MVSVIVSEALDEWAYRQQLQIGSLNKALHNRIAVLRGSMASFGMHVCMSIASYRCATSETFIAPW